MKNPQKQQIAANVSQKTEYSAFLETVTKKYAVAVTGDVLALIDPNDPSDPIAKQYLPDIRELVTRPDENADPIGDHVHEPVKGVVHRYPDRVLLKPVHACAVYCRFCFRREMVGPGGEALDAGDLDAAIAYIENNPDVWEVILTGGDPLVLSPRRLKDLIARIEAISHVKVIRIHTRLPAVAPAKITDEMLQALQTEKALFVAVHCNHARELTPAVRAALKRMTRSGITLLSQTVLLKGVNDTPQALEDLMRALVEAQVKPYYLHHLDLAPGTSHFRVAVAEGQRLVKSLRGRISGLCQPQYVIDIPGGFGKVPVTPDYLTPRPQSGYTVEDYRGHLHDYPENA